MSLDHTSPDDMSLLFISDKFSRPDGAGPLYVSLCLDNNVRTNKPLTWIFCI